ncbi:CCA tRNA nucleotidyltransferase [Streptococcus mutans]|uniref:CCA tRNA nucleotidyltransferase n=1 Tax=Streptococcus mutans TaxID=1309 RepID=UPI0002B4E479|nr:CCA tRNA nucleotidyltransferase [Streptococcus mutans]EMC06709.1 tRNA CCA-pyrophosphorylase [Streptococcus mutans NLML5]NLQ31743.1 CCA tRNA nucleotidyltransferase [Streptococcus mutans]
MRLKHLPSEFQEALPVLEKIKAAGFEAYFVGGSVRDVLLGHPIHDVDIASSSYPEETKKIFPRTVDIGIEHGTVLVLENGHDYEVTTFRTEDLYVDYRRPSQVSFVRSLEEDLKRRDFTINAFALDEKANIIDKFNGLVDLEQKILRAVGNAAERFNEDALRIMRGLRFAAQLNFDIEKKTFIAMREHAPLLEKISVERSFIEFDKLLRAPYWRKGINCLIASQAYDYLPLLQSTADKWQQLLTDLPEDFTFSTSEQAWAAVLLYLNVENPRSFLKSWKTSNDFQKTVEKLLAIYRLREDRQIKKTDVYQYSATLLMLVEELRQAQGLAVDFEHIKELDEALTIHDKHEIVVKGGDLMAAFDLKPGPDLGKILNQIESFIVAGNLANERQAILDFVRKEID